MDTYMAVEVPRTPPRNRVFPILMPPRPLSIEVDAILEKEAAVLSPTGPRTRSPSVTPMSSMPSPTVEELLIREQMDQVMLDVAHKCQEKSLSLEDAFPDDAAKVTSSELEAFLTEAGFENAAETATKMVDGCKKYIGDKTPMSPIELRVHTLKQALRVAVAKSLRPRSRSSCHSSPSTVPHSRLTTPLSTRMASTPTLGLIDENPEPLQTSSASPGSTWKRLGKSRFGRSRDSATLQQSSPERAPRALPAGFVALDENRPVSPVHRESRSPQKGLLGSKKENGGDQFGSQNQTRASKEWVDAFESPPKQPFAEFRDLNSKSLPGFISQVAVTASAKLHLAAGAAAFGNGTQRKLAFGPDKAGKCTDAPKVYPLSGNGKKRTGRGKYRQVPGTTKSSETTESAELELSSEDANSNAATDASKVSPVSPLKYLMKAMALTKLWHHDAHKAEDTMGGGGERPVEIVE